MNLDLIAAGACFVAAGCFFRWFTLSSPQRHTWMTLPHYVRRGMFVTGGMLLWRGANLTSISSSPAALGHLNAEGVLASLALAYTVVALVVHLESRKLAGRGHDRVESVYQAEKSDPDLVPVMMRKSEVASTLGLMGSKVLSEGASPQDLSGPLP